MPRTQVENLELSSSVLPALDKADLIDYQLIDGRINHLDE
jgi:hypothetical protein